MATQDFAPPKVAASAMNSIAASSCRALKSRGSRTSRKIERRLCMTTLPNQESLLQNQVFLATQYSFTYLRFPCPLAGEGREGEMDCRVKPGNDAGQTSVDAL